MLTQLNITSWRNIVGCWVSTRAANKVSVFDDMGMRLNQLSFPGNFHILAFNTIFILFFIGNTRGITVVLHYSIWLASKNGVVLEGELDVGCPGSSPGRVCTPSVTGWVLRLSPAWSPLSLPLCLLFYPIKVQKTTQKMKNQMYHILKWLNDENDFRSAVCRFWAVSCVSCPPLQRTPGSISVGCRATPETQDLMSTRPLSPCLWRHLLRVS